MNKNLNMMICAKYVRETTCKDCLHFRQCLKTGSPAPHLARYFGEMLTKVIPYLEHAIFEAFRSVVYIRITTPVEFAHEELSDDYIAMLKVYKKADYTGRIFCVCLSGDETADELREKAIDAYYEYRKGLAKS